MAMKVLFTHDYGREAMEAIEALGYEVMMKKENEWITDQELEGVAALVCYHPFKTLDIDRMKDLKWIQLSSIGIDQLPIEKVKVKGVVVTNNKGGYSIPMGEWIVLKILEIYKASMTYYRQQQQKVWKLSRNQLELYGKKVAFIGTGSIAREGVKRLQGFGCTLWGVNTKGRPQEGFHQCFPIEDLERVLAECDVVVLTIPYTESTHHLMNSQTLGAMKDESVLINVSRGSIIDQEALVKALERGKFLGIALDVFEEEPLPQEHPLWQLESVLISPHSAWISEMRNERRFETIYENLKRFKQGDALINQVDLEKGY